MDLLPAIASIEGHDQCLDLSRKSSHSDLMQLSILILLGICYATAIAFSGITLPVAAAELKVFSIGDGDTIRVSSPSGSNKTTVRLACIDAPEISQAPYGNDARQALQKELAIGTKISLRTKATDRYGRRVSEVLRGTININQALVAAGAFFVYWQYIDGCDLETYSRLENNARLKSLGIWAVPGGIQRPWIYRRQRN